jgi:outer membrane immunogenic protein
MKKYLLASLALVALAMASPAVSADVPVKAPVYKAPRPIVVSNSWTGFYVGANAGYGRDDGPTVTFVPSDPLVQLLTIAGGFGGTAPPPASLGVKGGLGGLQAGYNWQINRNWLAGFEADFDWSSLRGTGTSAFLLAGSATNFLASQNIRWFDTVRARLGYLATNDLLIYGTAGFAYGRVDENVTLNNLTNFINVGASFGFAYACRRGQAGCFAGGSSRTATGWTAGGGLEYAVWNNLSVKAEYLYVNLGHGDAVNVSAAPITFIPGAASSSFTASYGTLGVQVVRVGVNYRFGGPVVANY